MAGCLRVTHPFATRILEQAPKFPFDLHVLSTPPAFVLSQDQTLHQNIESYLAHILKELPIVCTISLALKCYIFALCSFQGTTKSLPDSVNSLQAFVATPFGESACLYYLKFFLLSTFFLKKLIFLSDVNCKMKSDTKKDKQEGLW